MLRPIFLASTLLISSISSFSISASENSNWAIGGLYYEFGGLIGAKYTHQFDEKQAATAALGLFGYSLGYEYTLDDHVKIGGMFGQDLFYADGGYLVGKASYYFSGVNSSGFYWGASAGFKEDVCVWCGQDNSDTKEIQFTGGIHFGYQF
ncbi:hypothetical protein C1E24_09300 [Pseudoalteromonas phenolica]|uniref:Outer membrane protein beta-barrel domain-containing protein n=1 Tax=Pseudoalteromonas phenolica TaxID=161398 RepID=A0A5R9Q393_9GAMM|nr:hypothetical protein [Pseudoalteromonas phenolica]TLX47284.1 hypothetical protein C1E24_09300 [Pseudoalteromonas phenolica]